MRSQILRHLHAGISSEINDLPKSFPIPKLCETASIFIQKKVVTVWRFWEHWFEDFLKRLQNFSRQGSQRHPPQPFPAVSRTLAKESDATFKLIDIAAFPSRSYAEKFTATCTDFGLKDDGCVVSRAYVWQ